MVRKAARRGMFVAVAALVSACSSSTDGTGQKTGAGTDTTSGGGGEGGASTTTGSGGAGGTSTGQGGGGGSAGGTTTSAGGAGGNPTTTSQGGAGGGMTTGTGGAGGGMTTGTGGAGGGTTTSAASGSAEIAAVRGAPDGVVNKLPVHDVLVTTVKPLLGKDAAGFFVQSEAAGPAIFIAVDPASLAPVPKAGDEVALQVTELATKDGLKQATGITAFSVVSSGNPVGPLVTDVSAAKDLVSSLADYESRALRITGKLGAFIAAGAPQVSAKLVTAGLDDAGFVLRMPEDVRAKYDLGLDCTVTVDPAAMWRYVAVAQPSVYDAARISNVTCPAPAVVAAVPLSATEVRVDFDRALDPATVDKTDFAFDNGLGAVSVVPNGKSVTVTTTADAAGLSYTVTVSTVNDVLGTPIGKQNTASFKSYVSLAKLLINEINPNITASHDLVELLATTAGSVGGITLLQKGTVTETLATLPDITVAKGDLIVVHLVPTGTTGIAPANELASKNEYTAASYSANYDGAWDVLGGAVGLTYSNRVIELDAPGNVVVDAVPFVLSNSAAPPAAFVTVLQALQAAGLWLPAKCGGVLCTYVSSPTAVAISVDYLGAGTGPTGKSVQRKLGLDTKQGSDWNLPAAHTFGLANP